MKLTPSTLGSVVLCKSAKITLCTFASISFFTLASIDLNANSIDPVGTCSNDIVYANYIANHQTGTNPNGTFSNDPVPGKPKGKLYIIGGGSRPVTMIRQIAELSGTTQNGYAFVLPMSSGEPESAIERAKNDFYSVGVKKVTGFNFKSDSSLGASNDINASDLYKKMIDSLRYAKLIYIPGGVQSNFMNAIKNTAVAEAIHYAYQNGALISGTSAGAAVMSRLMITGNQLNPRPGNGYVTIAQNNMELEEGLGLLPDVIIDQHFIMRQRLNRLVSVAIEYPETLCIGIDESTAIIVDGDIATVAGESQVIVIKNQNGKKAILNGLLGAKNMELSVYLPGESFKLR